MSRSPRLSAGFSLVELMIALVAGLVVIGAVLAFTVSSVKANSEFTRSTRLMQELRNVDDYIVDELKRAGYDEDAMGYVASNSATAVSPFSPIYVDATAGANCVIYAYDREPGTPGSIDLDSGEIRAIRRVTVNGVGVIEVSESKTGVTPACDGAGPDYTSYPVGCNSATGWCALSDPKVVNIGTFTVSDAAVANTSHGGHTIPGGVGNMPLRLREFRVLLAGSLVADASITRSIDTNVKVRSDCLRNDISDCNLAPAIPAP